jgi:hypothetical protein
LVALIFGYSGPAGGTSPLAAILLAAAFSALAAIASICRLLNIVRLHRPPRIPDSVRLRESREETTLRSPP